MQERKKYLYLNIIKIDDIQRTRISKIVIKQHHFQRKEVYLTINTFDWFDNDKFYKGKLNFSRFLMLFQFFALKYFISLRKIEKNL